jgi:hypothetical protein
MNGSFWACGISILKLKLMVDSLGIVRQSADKWQSPVSSEETRLGSKYEADK